MKLYDNNILEITIRIQTIQF